MSVDIIIPVYNAYEDLQICLQSIFRNTNLEEHRLILINDNSPDGRIRPFLDKQAEQHKNIIVYHNESNKGFSANINIGMAQSRINDVILLNSDTIVTADWVEKMVECAYSDIAIGTVTPVSNNASLCSVPNFCEENVLPEGMSVDDAAEIVERCSFRDYPDITVANGFCMLVKREVIDIIGDFDAETFGRGYGEENDFCNRAEQAGYKHVMCDNTYIYHSGTKSFVSKEKEEYIRQHEKILYQRYPDQMHKNAVHCRDNPNRRVGQNIGVYFSLYNKKKNLLYLVQSDFRDGSSDNIGGTQLHVHDLVYLLKDTYNIFVAARDGGNIAVTAYIENREIPFLFNMPQERDYLIISDKYLKELWNNILSAFRIDLIHIHHLHRTSFDICDVAHERNIPFLFTLHDFWFVCPSIKLLDDAEQVCIGKESTEKCIQCLQKQMNYAPTVDHISIWRRRCEKYLKMSQQIIVPSENTKEILSKYYSFVEDKTIVIEHGYRMPGNIQDDIAKSKTSDKVIAYFEKCSKIGGGFCAEGWAYLEDGDCRKEEIWLEIRNEKDEHCLIPTTIQFRPDVSLEERRMNCGFKGYIPVWICTGNELQIQILIKTLDGVLKENDIHTVIVRPVQRQGKLNIAFIGGLNAAKGGGKAAKIIRKSSQDVNWYVFGGIGVRELQDLEQDNLVKTGYYKPHHLPVLLREHSIDLICILSLWPETYSYTLTEAVINNIPVIVTNVGALGTRTLAGDYGWTVELDNVENSTIRLINDIKADRKKLSEKKQKLREVSVKSCEEMAQEYHKLYERHFRDGMKEVSFDAKYIYRGYLRANDRENVEESMDAAQKRQLDEDSAELKLLKSSLTYRIMFRILRMRIPFKRQIKNLLMKNR